MKRVEIRVKGHIDRDWSNWLAGLRVAYGDQGDTILTGAVADQAELYGVIAKLRDLGLVLLSVNHLEGGDATER